MESLMRGTALSLCLVTACAVDPSASESQKAIDKLFENVGRLPLEPARHIEGPPGPAKTDGDFQCVATQVDEVKQYDQLLGQLAIGDVMWPGALLRGDSVYTGRLTPLVFERAPETFSVSLESLAGGHHAATLASPSLSSYRDAVGQILAQEVTGATPARISADVEEISSEQQLAASLGASVSAPLVGSIKAGFNFSDQTKRSRYMVKYFQLYYTVDLDPPSQPHDFFAPSVDPADVEAVLPDSPPVYVSSIGYGRQVVFTFESDLSAQELGAALSFVYQTGAEVSGDVSLTHKEVLEHTRITAFILGGNGDEAATASIGTYDQLKSFIAKGGNYTKDSPGAAIAFKLSYVRDNAPVQVSYGSMYSRLDCSRVTQKLHAVFESITVDNAGGDLGNDLEVYGTVYARGTGSERTLMSLPSSMYQQIGEGKSFPMSGIVGEAIVPVNPQPGSSIVIGTSLMEDDGIADDSFGTRIETAAPYEAGWRRTLILHRSSGTQQISLRVTLTPVP
jgi:thiol-activated cytolysin